MISYFILLKETQKNSYNIGWVYNDHIKLSLNKPITKKISMLFEGNLNSLIKIEVSCYVVWTIIRFSF